MIEQKQGAGLLTYLGILAHEIQDSAYFGNDRPFDRLCGENNAARCFPDSGKTYRLPERGKTAVRQALCGMPFVLQFPLPA
jgi:hypothetical protein